MNIVNHPLCTTSIGAPSDMLDDCSALPVAYHTDEHGTWAVSFWKPEPPELATLVAGGGITLHVRAHARQHPVVAIGVYPSFEDLDAPAAAALQMNDISIDIETLSTRYDAAILSIGAVAFDRKTGVIGERMYVEVDVSSALQFGNISGSTLEWWVQQDAKATQLFGRPGKIHLAVALQQLAIFMDQHSGAKVWGNGATFDITILEHAFTKLGHPVPWKYWDVRDMRTLVEAAAAHGFDKRTVPFDGVRHNAVDDAAHQARVIARSWMICADHEDQTEAARDVMAERRRQVTHVGYDAEHDDAHPSGEIAACAAYYAMPPEAREWPSMDCGYGPTFGAAMWPERWSAPKTGDRRRELVKAGALILAEIERIDRGAKTQDTP